jgi:hypothetical protein
LKRQLNLPPSGVRRHRAGRRGQSGEW